MSPITSYYEAYTEEIPFARRGVAVAIYAPITVLKPEAITIADGVRVDGMTKLEGGLGLDIGRWVHIGSFSHINVGGGSVRIGQGAAICSHAILIAGSNAREGHYMSAAAPEELQIKERSFIRVGEGAFIGCGAIIEPGVTIGDFAIIWPGAVVTHDVPAWEEWAGVPASKIRDRVRPEGSGSDSLAAIRLCHCLSGEV